MQLGAIITALDGIRGVSPPTRAGWAATRICDLTEDSRTVLPGSLFVARAGLKADGRRFVREAINAGAVALLTDDESLRGCERGHDGVPVVVAGDVALATARVAERFYGDPSRKLATLAVTGTNGKTTTTFLIWKMLNALGVRCGLIGTVIVDDGRSVGASSMTTPPAIELSRSLSAMVEAGCRAVALEASSHALDQKRIDGLRVRVGVFTNLTGDHLDYHKTMETYAGAKARLFTMLDADGTAIVNSNDPAAERMVKGCRAPISGCAVFDGEQRPSAAPCRVEATRSTIDGMALLLTGPWGTASATVPLIGRYNAMNVLQAAVACDAVSESLLGARLNVAQLQTALENISAPPGRLEPAWVRTGKRHARSMSGSGAGLPKVFVDYAHTDDALRNVLTAVRGVITPPTRLWVVFGAGGDKDTTKRPRMGLAAAELADRVVVTSDNPRSEKPATIVGEILSGIPPAQRDKVEVQVERGPAIRYAIANADAHDVIVIAGKGHETEQVVMGDNGKLFTIEFDDRLVAAGALAERQQGAGGQQPVDSLSSSRATTTLSVTSTEGVS